MSYDALESQLHDQMAPWSVQQSLAFIAILAERGLQRYGAAAQLIPELAHYAELRVALDLVWHHLEGVPMAAAALRSARSRVEAATPHLDDIDRPDALAACVQVSSALDVAGDGRTARDQVGHAITSEMIGAVDAWLDEDAREELWSTPAAQEAAGRLRRLADLVSRLRTIDAASLRALRDQRV